MSTLLLRLAAPLQSWGVDSKFERRNTERTPTKSGVIGMLAAALGRSRESSIEDLAALHFGVRVDKEGELLRDYQTVKSKKSAYVTHRYYLADAKFTVGLEGDERILEDLAAAVKAPQYPLFLGRRSCPPAEQVFVDIVPEPLREALAGDGRAVFDAEDCEPYAYLQQDIPVSFSQQHRRFSYRRVSDIGKAASTSLEHDAMAVLEDE